jgi:hypothetical protein
MAKADAIMKEIGDYVLQLPVEQCLIRTQDEIQAVCEHHQQLLLCLDGYFSAWPTNKMLPSKKQNNNDHDTLLQP